VGSTVRHPQFGVGIILNVIGGFNARVQVRFRDVGTKTLVLEHARLERIG
jgi:DNA helicase-2/ATP-dependent DNA helicase PcrA